MVTVKSMVKVVVMPAIVPATEPSRTKLRTEVAPLDETTENGQVYEHFLKK